MRLSEIQNKDVININTGMKVGNIIDVKVNSETGKIESLILEKKKFSSFFSSNDEIEIYWNQINKIGEDVILVESLTI
ncbi:MAG: YlmC/YmxH family sporulation protein [Bacilli bacterium]|nr:YlmC/YmxH family sporulation protein [Bacilli bacterium]